MIRSLLPVFAVLVSSLVVGCGASRPPAVVASADDAHDSAPVVKESLPDQDVPLLAPDEASTDAANPRLTSSRTIGVGNQDPVYEKGRPRRGGDGSAAGQGIANGARPPTALGTRGYYSRGASYTPRAVYTNGTNGATGPGNPGVGGSFPAAKSFGPAAAR